VPLQVFKPNLVPQLSLPLHVHREVRHHDSTRAINTNTYTHTGATAAIYPAGPVQNNGVRPAAPLASIRHLCSTIFLGVSGRGRHNRHEHLAGPAPLPGTLPRILRLGRGGSLSSAFRGRPAYQGVPDMGAIPVDSVVGHREAVTVPCWK
jgi:hypothetical protein